MHLTDPQTLNRYAYARNNPLSLVDPTGKDPCDWDPSFCDWGDADPFGVGWFDWQSLIFGPPDPSLLVINDNWGYPGNGTAGQGTPEQCVANSVNRLCKSKTRRCGTAAGGLRADRQSG